MDTLELVRSHSLPTVVRHELERRILAGEILPGAKLNEAEVAEALKVSRGPVREAFRALEQAGLVRTEKNRGVFVRSLTHFEADELYRIVDLMRHLRGSETRRHVRAEVPFYTGRRRTPAELITDLP